MILTLVKDNYSHFFKSELFDWCVEQNIQVDEPQAESGLYETFVIHLRKKAEIKAFKNEYPQLLTPALKNKT